MSTSASLPTSFITLIVSKTSVSASTATSSPISTSAPAQSVTSTPDAPTAGYIWADKSNDGWSPVAIIGIVTTIVLLILLVPLVAVLLRRYERHRLQETVKPSGSSDRGSTKSSLKDDPSLRSIMVTKELQRTSAKLVDGVIDRPEQVHAHGRAWSRTEVKGGLK